MELDSIINQAKGQIDAAEDAATLDQVRVEFMGKKGKLTDMLKGLGKLSAEERPAAGQKINQAKQQIQQAISAKGDALRTAEMNKKLAEEAIDVTLPGRTVLPGNLHPVSRTIARIEQFFSELGFAVKTGPEAARKPRRFSASISDRFGVTFGVHFDLQKG